MGFRQWLHKKTSPSKRNNITDEMRSSALALRRQEHAIKQKEKELALMERIVNIEVQSNPKDSVMDMAIKEMLPFLMQKMKQEKGVVGEVQQYPQIPPTPQTHLAAFTPKAYTKDEIKNIVAANPKIAKHAKNFTDDQIKEYIMGQIPDMDAHSIKTIIQEVRT